MVTTFTSKSGKTISPEFFAVYTLKGGTTIKRIQDSIDESDLSRYDDLRKVELYKNGTENLAPQMLYRLSNKF